MSATVEVCAEAVSPACDPVWRIKDVPTVKSRRTVNRAGANSNVVHVRVDGFFAAVEQVMRPKFGGRPVLVGDGVVVSASYEAKFFEIKVGMPIADALRFCPSAIVLPGRYDRYAEYAERVRAIAEMFTPVVEADACHGFYLDFCGSEHVWQDFPGTLRRLQLEILKHTGLSISVGAGRTRAVAAIASRIEQPRGIRIVACGTEEAFLSALPVEALGGIVAVDAAKLRKCGISTMAELRRVPLASLEAAYGGALRAGLTFEAPFGRQRRGRCRARRCRVKFVSKAGLRTPNISARLRNTFVGVSVRHWLTRTARRAQLASAFATSTNSRRPRPCGSRPLPTRIVTCCRSCSVFYERFSHVTSPSKLWR